MSWKPEVIADNSGHWCGNGLRFATEQEAKLNVADLARRWMLVRETRVVESDEPVNYRWIEAERRLELLPEQTDDGNHGMVKDGPEKVDFVNQRGE